ncbi:MAG: hypothetical protein OXL96_13840 [Candidatus Poribacteria bacterium]|nr:hypothetical protein [Candidatus Poribacteria bacterium]
MSDLRTQLPECPLAYEVPFIPTTHTALVIPVTAADIEWQEKMLPWTLASLINNTDIIMRGIHLYIICSHHTEARIQAALKNFDLPENTILAENAAPLAAIDYASIPVFDLNYWAFRDARNALKLDFADMLKDNKIEAEPYPPCPPTSPSLCDMTHCTIEQFRHAIKHIMGAQLAMRV